MLCKPSAGNGGHKMSRYSWFTVYFPGPLIAAADRQALIDQNEAVRFPEQGFDPVPSSSTEKEESTGRRIHLKLVLDNGTESVNGFPHIGVTTDNVDLLKSGDVT